MNDIKFAFRQLLKNKGFTAVAVLTLAICIGANITIFSVVDAILVRSLPLPGAERLVFLHNKYPGAGVERGIASWQNYFDRREGLESFQSVSLFDETSFTVGDPGSPRRVDGMRVTPEFFTTLGVPLAAGRLFTDAELDFETDEVAIITDRFWRNQFDADPDILGSTFSVNSQPTTVIGVLPADFQFLSTRAEFFRPLSHSPEDLGVLNLHSDHGHMIARLAEGSSFTDAQAELDVFNVRQLAEDPLSEMIGDIGYYTHVVSVHEDHVSGIRPILILLQIGVLFLLLIGAFNIVNLLLIRTSSRMKETAVRQALGATRRHVVREALTETIMLGVGGGLLGLLFAAFGIDLIWALGGEQLPLGTNIEFGDRLVLVSLLGSTVVGVLLSIPVIGFKLHSPLASNLQSDGRGSTSSRSIGRLRHGFSVAQIALAFVLLSGAGLLGASLKQALDVSPGFESQQVVSADLYLPRQNYPDAQSRATFASRLLLALRSLPGVTHSAISTALPFTIEASENGNAVLPEGFDPTSGDSLSVHFLPAVSKDYWEAMDIPLLEGRFLTDADNEPSALRVAVIDQALARSFWPDGDAIGRRFSDGVEFDENNTYAVVGIVGNAKQNDLTEADGQGAAYLPYGVGNSATYSIIVRASASPIALAATIRQAIARLDPNLPVEDFKTMQDRVDDSLVMRRSPAILLTVFAMVSLLLAAIGTYGVLAYAVGQRRREIGVRMAIGALPQQIRRQFLAAGLRLVVMGTLFGVLGALAAGRAMQNILFDLPALHLPKLLGVAGVMTVVSLIACLIPAMRAANTDPMEALRSE